MTRTKRHFPQRPSFSWVGEQVPPPPHMRKADFPHYRSFTLGELTAEVGDYVIIQNDATSEDLNSLEVARLDGLYEDRMNDNDPHRAVITWLCRPNQLPKTMDLEGYKEQNFPPLDDRFDLVLEARDYQKDISADSIYYKCFVHIKPPSTDPEDFINRVSSPDAKPPHYVLRFKMITALEASQAKRTREGKSNKNTSSKGTKKKFVLDAYMDGLPSPAKRATKSLLKERNQRSSPPSTPDVSKIQLPDNLELKLLKVVKVDLSRTSQADVKKRRLSSRGNSRENTPAKKSKKSDSVPVSPEVVPKTPTRSTTASQKSSRRTPKIKNNMDVDETPTSATVKETQRKATRTPKRSAKKSYKTEEKMASESEQEKTMEIEKENESDENLTKIVTATGSGRKVTIKFANRNRFAPSSGLGDSQISSMLELSDDEFEEEQKKLISKPKSQKPAPSPKKRVRRASLPAVQKTPEKTVTNSRRSLAASESKIKNKKIEPVESDSGDSDFESESSESDFEDAPKKKPGKLKQSKAINPGTLLINRREFHPGVAPRDRPVKPAANQLVEAQQRLHVSAVPDCLPCREDEFAEVFGYVEGKLQEGSGGCIYISGVPGTGKTATVKQVMRYMEENRDEYPDFNFYELNGMRLTCPEQIYVEMWRQLTGQKLVHEQAMKKLDQRFATAAPKRVHTIFLVDELDMLCKKKQTVLYNIFEWPSRPQGKVIIIAIANTMDLPERDMDMRVISRLGFNRLHFEPYNQLQLQTIVSSRLEGLSVFQSDELQLVSRKVASLSGDCRRALDICRILAERAEREGRDRVTTEDVLKVHKEMFSSLKFQYIRGCSKLEQFFLRSMVNEFIKTGVEETQLRNIYLRLEEVCASEGVHQPPLLAVYDISARLSSQRLILSEDYRKGLDTKLRLNVGFDDINFALNPRNE